MQRTIWSTAKARFIDREPIAALGIGECGRSE
jgi:hypothetical protein